MSRRGPSPVSVALERSSGQPLPRQLASSIRSAVQRGALAAGERLPSTRALADDLGVARGVVADAFDQLIAEGWLLGVRGSGTFVADGVRTVPAERLARRAPHADRVSPPQIAAVRLDSGTPWLDDRLRAGWNRAWHRVATARMPADYPDPRGLPELRAAIADHVSRHRGLACSADNVVVTAGTAHGFGLVLAARRSHSVAIEDPGYRAAVATAVALGRRVVDIPVDADGIDAERLSMADVDAVYVTPAHQHPLGVTMSAARRVALVAEASRRDLTVIEDDYDSEFRYDVAPLPALAQLDPGRVVYLGTASKTLGPGLRLGWIVGPQPLADEIARLRDDRHDTPPWPAQRALLSMLEEGYLTRLVRSARRQYAVRSRAVQSAMAGFGELSGGGAGMYATLSLDAGVAERVSRRALAGGVDVPLLASYCRTAVRGGLVIGYGGVSDDQLAAAVAVLVRALRAEAAAPGRSSDAVRVKV
jgi:GntR family transcriptional regulator / MocR family aminotransferase